MKRMISLFAVGLLFCATALAVEQQGTKDGQSQSTSASSKVYDFPQLNVNTDLYKTPPKGDSKEMALQFFELNKDHYHIKNPREEFLYQGTRESKLSGTKRVDFKQVYRGIPVDAGARVWFDRYGNLESVKVTYYDIIDLPTTPSIDSASAVTIALQNMESAPRPKVVGPGKPFITSSKVFRPVKEDRLYLVWKVEIHPDSTRRYDLFDRFYIDALSGTILYRERDSIGKR